MKHFTLSELTRSATADRLAIDNRPPAQAVANLHALVALLLDPLRDAMGEPVYVNSGYRCPRLNEEVNGAQHSQHMQGLAADIRPATPSRLLEMVAYIEERLPFDQLIIYRDFLHVSISETLRHEIIYKSRK